MNLLSRRDYLRRSGFSLIEILVVMAIIVVLSSITYGVYLGGHSKNAPPGKAHSPMERAKDVVCMENLRSVRQCVEASRSGDSDGKFPGALTEMRELTAELRACPEGKEPYQYDPATGQVKCVHPGHENY